MAGEGGGPRLLEATNRGAPGPGFGPLRGESGALAGRGTLAPMATYRSLEQVQAAREKRRGVFEKARGMRDSGQISEAEFQLLKQKYDQKMEELDRAEAELGPAEPEPPPPPPPAPEPEVPTEEVLGMARDILGRAEATPPEPEPPPPPPPHPDALVLPGDPGAEDSTPRPGILDAAALQAVAGILQGADREPSYEGDVSGGFTAADLAGLSLEEDLEDDGDDPLPPASLAALGLGSGSFHSDSTPTDPGAPVVMGSGDADLLSLVRGGFGGDSDRDSEGKLHSERAARELAEKRSAEKEREAAEMHEAFRRAVDEKDRMGEKLLDVRRQGKKLWTWLRAAVVIATAGSLGALLLWSRQAKLAGTLATLQSEAGALKAQRQADLTQIEELRKNDKAAEDARRLAAVARSLKDAKEEVEGRLASATARVGELEEALAARPAALPGGGAGEGTGDGAGGGTAGFVPDPDRDAALLDLLARRGRDLVTAREDFLAAARAEQDDVDELLAELDGRREAGLAGPAEQALELLLRGRGPAAREQLELALDESTRRAGVVRAVLAAVLLNQGDAEAARKLLEGVTGSDAEAQEGRRALVSEYRKLRRFDQAREVLDQVLASEFATTDDYLQAGILADMAEDRAAAEAAYRQVFARDPDNARAISLLSSLAIERKDWAQARTYLEKAVARSPEDPDLQFNLALALIGLGEAEAARPLVSALVTRSWPGAAALAQQVGVPGTPPETPDGGGGDGGDGGAAPAPEPGGFEAPMPPAGGTEGFEDFEEMDEDGSGSG